MKKARLGYNQVEISHKQIGQYTMLEDICVTDIANDMSEITSFAVETNLFQDMHTHDFYDIAWVERGGFDYIVDTKTYHVEDKTILMFLPGGMHCLQNTGMVSGVTIDFTEEYFRSIDPAWAHIIKYDIMDGMHVLPIRNKESEKEIKNLINQLRQQIENRNGTVLTTASCYSTLTLLLCAVGNSPEHKAIKNNAAITNNPTHTLYLSFVDLVEKNFYKYHSVQFYAETLHVGNNTLNSCCKMNVCKTPLAVITDRILLEAKRMLLYTELRSNEISARLGFIEPAHFSNFFKKHMKITPLKYRENRNIEDKTSH